MSSNYWGPKIAAEAKEWPGEWFGKDPAQCMNWVREVLRRVGHPYAAKATATPVDGMDPGLGFANSLAGRDMGTMIVKTADLAAGDIVFWDNTYGDYPRGTITHVGIYVGGGDIVHRPTMSRPVERIRLADYPLGEWRCGLRIGGAVPEAKSEPAPAPATKSKVKIVAHSGKLRMQLDGKWIDLDSLELSADY